MSRTIASVLAAAMLILAGCGASVSPGSSTSAIDGTTTDPATTANTGTVNFYISDERNAIGDFEHLNVTITKVGFKKVDDDGSDAADENETDAEPTENDTVTGTAANETETETETEDDEREDDEGEEDDREDDEDGNDGEGEDDGDWVTYEVDNRTVDLTELQGTNASQLEAFEVPNGTYTKVFVYVSEINGTLKDGTQVNVKLPSQKLQLDKRFTVGNDESVDFVFDITVFKAGKSGKYILKPIVSESGVDQPIDEIGEEDGEDEDEAEDEDDDAREDGADLQARFVGPVEPGADATVAVTRQGEPVANATVRLNGDRVGATGPDGRITVAIPADVGEVEIEITAGDDEVSLEREFDERGNDAGNGTDDDG